MEYPYYIIPDIEALPNASGEERQRLVRRIAALIGNPLALRNVLGIDPEEFMEFYPDMAKPELSTEDTIDSFIDKFGDKKVIETKEATDLEELIPLPAPEYDLSSIDADPIISDEEEMADSDPTADLLNSFLKPAEKKQTPKTPEKIVPKETPEPKRTENPSLSESLARAMIKNGNYRKALEIITDLSLKNPKKSIYFADQIRFLKKLILNQSKSQN